VAISKLPYDMKRSSAGHRNHIRRVSRKIERCWGHRIFARGGRRTCWGYLCASGRGVQFSETCACITISCRRAPRPDWETFGAGCPKPRGSSNVGRVTGGHAQLVSALRRRRRIHLEGSMHKGVGSESCNAGFRATVDSWQPGGRVPACTIGRGNITETEQKLHRGQDLGAGEPDV
jgi:hypothetical protein